MFEPVVIACDGGSLDFAQAIRASLEHFRLRVYLHYCVQQRNARDVLAGHIPDCRYVVLCTHGLANAGEMSFGFLGLVEEVEGQWTSEDFVLTPNNIPDLVHLPGKTVISGGCESGREPFARAFLEAGCHEYIAPVKPVDQDAGVLFVIGFFYHLLAEDRQSGLSCSVQEAVERARAFDPLAGEGTHVFRYYSNEETLP